MIATDFIFGRKYSKKWDLIIGGVGGSITNIAELQSKITGGTVTDFEVKEGDVYASFTPASTYYINTSAFSGNTSITSFKDLGNKCIQINGSSFTNSTIKEFISGKATSMANAVFRNAIELELVELPLMNQIAQEAFRDCKKLPSLDLPSLTTVTGYFLTMGGCTLLQNINIPLLQNIGAMFAGTPCLNLDISSATIIGGTTANNNVFSSFANNGTVKCPTALQTVNEGNEEGDVAYLRNTKNFTVTYI